MSDLPQASVQRPLLVKVINRHKGWYNAAGNKTKINVTVNQFNKSINMLPIIMNKMLKNIERVQILH